MKRWRRSHMSDHDDAVPVITLRAELFPSCFFVYEGHRRPLKIGIRDDIAAQVHGAIGSACDLPFQARPGARRSRLWRAVREPRRALHARIAETITSDFDEISDNQPEQLARHSLV